MARQAIAEAQVKANAILKIGTGSYAADISTDGTNLTDDAGIRSEFQQAIGKYNLEAQLEKLSKDPEMIASMKLMRKDIRAGNRAEYNARDYKHNIVIDRLFKEVRRLAWNDIKYRQDILALTQEQKQKKVQQEFKTRESNNLLSMYK